MSHKIDERIEFIREIHDNSNFSVIVFNQDKNIFYNNETFKKTFNIRADHEYEDFFSYFIIEKNEKSIPLRDFPLLELTSDSQIFASVNINKCDYCYKLALSLLGELDGKNVFYASIFELSSMKEKFLERSMNALVNASLLKDNETGNHVKRINEYSHLLTEYLYKTRHDIFPEINDYFIYEISKVASLHDVGKIGTPDYILTKPGKLTEEEFNIIKEHTINGALILSGFASDMARDIALFHHERWDGSGYPYNLYQDQTPLSARIVSITDVYDALRMKRYYKDAYTHEESLKIIKEGREKHFQSEIVDAFLEINETMKEIFNTLLDQK